MTTKRLSEEDIKRIAEAIMNSRKFREEVEEHWVLLERAMKDVVDDKLHYLAVDQAKFRMINEILTLDYAKTLKQIEGK